MTREIRFRMAREGLGMAKWGLRMTREGLGITNGRFGIAQGAFSLAGRLGMTQRIFSLAAGNLALARRECRLKERVFGTLRIGKLQNLARESAKALAAKIFQTRIIVIA